RKRRPNARHTTLAFKRFHQGRFFTNFISPGAAVPVNVEIASAAEDILADKSLVVGVFDRLLHDVREISILAANVDVPSLRPHSESRNHHTLNYRVWVVFKNQPVFASARFALIAVAQNILRLS